MVTLKKRKTGNKTYYYLGHTYREGGKFRYKETYLGVKLPKDIEKAKKEFMLEIYGERWFAKFDEIRNEYKRELAKTPLDIRRKNLEAFVIRFTYDTNRIEGSKLSLKDTAALLEFGISPKDRPIRDVKEAEAHRRVFYEMINTSDDLSLGMVLTWHKEMFGETKKGIAGRLRDYSVYISGSEFVPPDPETVAMRVAEFFEWYAAEKNRINPVELAALVHMRFETIHPFGDGNGRIGRLIMNFILNRNGYPMLDIRYTDRKGYYSALERANVKNDDMIFVQWFFKRYIKESRIYLKKLHA